MLVTALWQETCRERECSHLAGFSLRTSQRTQASVVITKAIMRSKQRIDAVMSLLAFIWHSFPFGMHCDIRELFCPIQLKSIICSRVLRRDVFFFPVIFTQPLFMSFQKYVWSQDVPLCVVDVTYYYCNLLTGSWHDLWSSSPMWSSPGALCPHFYVHWLHQPTIGDFVKAMTSIRSPLKLFICILKCDIYRIKVSKTYIFN